MITVTAYGDAFECVSYKKGDYHLSLYDEAGNCTVSFGGISNWDGYEIDGVPVTEIAAENGGEQ
jgi:hypothetical protein